MGAAISSCSLFDAERSEDRANMMNHTMNCLLGENGPEILQVSHRDDCGIINLSRNTCCKSDYVNSCLRNGQTV